MIIDVMTNEFMRLIENPILTILSMLIEYTFDPISLLVIGILVSAFLYFKISKKKGIWVASTIIITAIIIKLLKEIIQRARPIDAIISSTSSSFPSGHTIMAVVFFGLMAYLFMSKKHSVKNIVTAIIIILVIAFTRLYLRVHWLTDVLAGLVIGGIILTAAIWIYSKYIK